MFVGVDGIPGGWIAVVYDEAGFSTAEPFDHVEALWETYGAEATRVLIDVPIGLREDSNAKRSCDAEARRLLSPDRHSSVFPPPVRAAVYEETYEEAKAVQERRTDGSLGVQAWGIADKIAELDRFLRETTPAARETVLEAHPEVCFWALNDEVPTEFSKTGQPAAAFWERIEILEEVDAAVLDHVRAASAGLDHPVGLDDVADAFCLAVTASPLTGPLETLPTDSDHPDRDPVGLPMQMVYARPQARRSTRLEG